MHLDDLYINKTKKPLLCPEEPTINCLSAAISITWAGLLCPCVIKLKIVAESFNSAVSSAGEGWIEAPALQLAVLASSPAPLRSLAAGITSTQDGAESSFTVAFCLLLLQINPSSYFFFFLPFPALFLQEGLWIVTEFSYLVAHSCLWGRRKRGQIFFWVMLFRILGCKTLWMARFAANCAVLVQAKFLLSPLGILPK